MNATDQHRHLAWFLGPKAENAEVMESLLLQVLRDYFHWRKNYFPGDPILVTRSLQRDRWAPFQGTTPRCCWVTLCGELMACCRQTPS